MDLHAVRRIATVLVASQLRSGRSTSDPKSLFARPAIFAVVDVALFGVLFGLTSLVVPADPRLEAVVYPLLLQFLPYLPLYAVATVLVAGITFELTATAKFTGSDAVNWLPVTPGEYVLASSTAIAYTYSPALALILGPVAALSLGVGLGGSLVLVGVLAAVGLLEGAFLVEMVRAATQRVGSGGGRHGRLSLVVRAVALLVLVLALQLAFNPVFLLDSLHGLGTLDAISAYVPVFWATHALDLWLAGAAGLALLFGAGQVAFAALLLGLAAEMRVRFWVVTATEYRFSDHAYASEHPFLAALGLSRAEAAIVSKDFTGLTRRREMLPMLVVPLVIVIVLLVETTSGAGAGAPGPWEFILVEWAGGFFALLLATTSVGQERRAMQTLFAAPLVGRNVFRAKLTSVVVPALLVTAAISVGTGVFFGAGGFAIAGLALVGCAAATAVGVWGLAFAARYSDFQERPRPQYLRPSAMMAAVGSGMAILFSVLIPGGIALTGSGSAALAAGAVCAAVAIAAIGAGWHFARVGFDQLLRELPF
jgi:hypothetical protein